jgi:hypothetical protein
LEKVIHLLNLLEGFNRHPFLKERLALKGGTALNLFLFRSLGDSESMPNLLQRKQDIPGTRRPGPASAPPFR